MNVHFHTRLRNLLGVLGLLSFACNATLPAAIATQTEPSVTTATPLIPATTAPATAEPVQPPTAVVPVNTVPAEVGQQCTLSQDLNLRSGPGTAYRPPLGIIKGNTVVVPTGYRPVGIPGGSWIFVRDPNSPKTGWISAGAAYVTCNFVLATLPDVAAAAPPPPTPQVASSNEEGLCFGGSQTPYDCSVVVANNSLVQYKVFKDGQEIGRNDDIEIVTFTVRKDNTEIYTTSDTTAAYCIFGGDDSCNSWILEDNVYKWEAGGAPVEAGTYRIDIDPTMSPEIGVLNLHWNATITITLP